MKRLLVSLALLGALAAHAQTSGQFTGNAATFAARAAYPTIVVQEAPTKGQWVQMVARATNTKWHTKRMDPGQVPLSATVSLDLYSGVSEPKPTRDEANDIAELPLTKVERIELEYLPRDGGWVFSKGTSTSRGQTTALQPVAAADGFSPSNWVIQGFSVRP
ncbi:MAG: hypothetical protein V4562_03630 [Pseudomonadota bacterium]